MVQKPKGWNKFFGSLFKTPKRAIVTIVLIVLIILSGVLRALVNAFIANVFMPMLIFVLLVALLIYIWNGGKRR